MRRMLAMTFNYFINDIPPSENDFGISIREYKSVKSQNLHEPKSAQANASA